jgi:type IV pilus assembly protein PilE
MNPIKKKGRGFSLVELMFTVAIVAVLAAIAYPSYRAQIRKTHRADAQGALMGLANAMERFYTENNTYVGAAQAGTLPQPPLATLYPSEAPISGTDKYYDLDIQAATGSLYTLRATPKNTQVGDGYLELTSTGERRWDKDDDNSIGIGEDSW